MKVYVDTWIYVTEKFGNMGFIEVYRGILRYETGIYPTIPNFIYVHSPLKNPFICKGRRMASWLRNNAVTADRDGGIANDVSDSKVKRSPTVASFAAKTSPRLPAYFSLDKKEHINTL